MNDETTIVKLTPRGKMGRRYEIVDDGDTNEDEYAYYQSTTHRPLRSKYEPARRSLAEKQQQEKGRIVTFVANGDIHCNPFEFTYSHKWHKNFVNVCEDLKRLQDTKNAGARNLRIKVVHRIFCWKDKREIHNLNELLEEESKLFVYSDMKPLSVSSVEKLIEKFNVNGGGAPKISRNSYNSRGSQKTSPTLRSLNSMNSMAQPINIVVKSNTHRKSTCSVMLNPKQDFQMLLDIITDSLSMEFKPCLALYPVVKEAGHHSKQDKIKDVKIESMSQFKRLQVKSGDVFIACGSEGPPTEIGSQGKNGVANGHGKKNDGYTDRNGRAYQRHNSNRKSQHMDEDQSPNRSPRRDDQRDRRNGPYGNGHATPRRQVEEQNGYEQHSDPEDDRYGQRNYDDDNDRERMRSSASSRGDSPDDDELGRRIRDMEVKGDLDKDVEF